MGKRKKASGGKPQGPKRRAALATTFACLFCNHENSVTVKLDKKAATGELSCKVCGQQFQTGINYLSAAVDVYSDWIDACDAVAKDATGGASAYAARGNQAAEGDGYSDGGLDREGDTGIMDDEIGEAEYND